MDVQTLPVSQEDTLVPVSGVGELKPSHKHGSKWVDCCWAPTATTSDPQGGSSGDSRPTAAVLVGLSRQALEVFIWQGDYDQSPVRVYRHRSEIGSGLTLVGELRAMTPIVVSPNVEQEEDAADPKGLMLAQIAVTCDPPVSISSSVGNGDAAAGLSLSSISSGAVGRHQCLNDGFASSSSLLTFPLDIASRSPSSTAVTQGLSTDSHTTVAGNEKDEGGIGSSDGELLDLRGALGSSVPTSTMHQSIVNKPRRIGVCESCKFPMYTVRLSVISTVSDLLGINLIWTDGSPAGASRCKRGERWDARSGGDPFDVHVANNSGSWRYQQCCCFRAPRWQWG